MRKILEMPIGYINTDYLFVVTNFKYHEGKLGQQKVFSKAKIYRVYFQKTRKKIEI